MVRGGLMTIAVAAVAEVRAKAICLDDGVCWLSRNLSRPGDLYVRS
jgi:hypothetical protein